MIAFLLVALAVDALAVDAGAGSASGRTAQAAALRDAKDILEDYAKAIGDEGAWRRHSSVRVKRQVSVAAMHFTSFEETRLAKGGRMFSTSEMPGMGTFKRGCDGKQAWAEDPIGGLRVLKGAEAEDVRLASVWNSEWRLAQTFKKVVSVPVPASAPARASLECVELHKRVGQPSTLCFDKRTHLRAWEKGVQASQGGEVPYVTTFSDWQPVQGILVWHREQVNVGPVTMDAAIVEIVFDEPTPASLFALPKVKK